MNPLDLTVQRVLALAYQNIDAANQELQRQLNAAQARIAELEARLSELEPKAEPAE